MTAEALRAPAEGPASPNDRIAALENELASMRQKYASILSRQPLLSRLMPRIFGVRSEEELNLMKRQPFVNRVLPNLVGQKSEEEIAYLENIRKNGPEMSTIIGTGAVPEDVRSLNADWFGARNMPEGYNNVVWKPGQRTAYMKSVAGKAFMPMAVSGTLAGAGSSIASVPLIGQTPYLPAIAGGLQSGMSALTAPLGLGTGINATNAVMATLPTWAGPLATGALVIPTALAAIGLAKGVFMNKRYGGYWNNVRAASRIPMEVTVAAYRGIMSARERAGTFIGTAYEKLAKKPAQWVGKQINDYVIPAIQPNTLSVGGAVLGTSLALMSGTPIGMGIAGGYFGVKAMRKIYEKLSGNKKAS